MNILSITGILPIPGVVKKNDFLIPLYSTYQSIYNQDKVYFIRLEKTIPFSKHNKKFKDLNQFEIMGFRVTMLRYLSVWRFPGLHALIASYSAFLFNRRKIDRFIKANAIDIIHAEYFFPDGYLAYLISRKLNIPYLLTTHHEFRYFDNFISKRLAIKTLRKAAYITPLNYASYELYKKFTDIGIVVVPHGIDERFLKITPVYQTKGKIKVLTIAALLRYKNIDKVLSAVAELKDQFDFQYTIVGTGPQEKALNAMVDKLGLKDRVDFLPKVEYKDIPAFMGNFDVFILPSYFESFGRVLFEAMAVGLPTICARNSGIHRYFKEKAEGLSVDHNNLKDIKDKLALLMGDATLRREMGARAKKMMHHYTWDNIAATFHDLYEKAASQQKANK